MSYNNTFGETYAINNQVTSYIENRIQFKKLKNKRDAKMYILFDENPELTEWFEEDVKEFDVLFSEGWTVKDLAGYFGRTNDEVALLIMERAIRGKIKIEDRQLVKALWRSWGNE